MEEKMADRNNHKPHLRYKINITFLIFVLFSAFAVDNIPASEDQVLPKNLLRIFSQQMRGKTGES
jgi:hypothetical protein